MKIKIREYWIYPVVALAAAFICATFAEPESRQNSHYWRGWIAAFGGLFIVVRLLFSKFVIPKSKVVGFVAKKIYFSILTAVIVFSIFNYYQFDRKWASGMDDYTDIAYYYLNTKYLDELGYMGFYAAVLTADREYKNRCASKIKRYRDLRDYEMKSTKVAFLHGEEVKNNFTPERWEQFQKDSDYFLQRKTLRGLNTYFFTDHGYNPPPTWAAPAAIFTSLADVQDIKIIAMADIVWVVAMLAVTAWAFGFEVMLYLALFFFCTFSGRWPVLSHSLLRFDWSSALVMSIAFMKKDKWVTSGAFLAYAALNRVFPAIFFYSWIIFIVWTLIKKRKITVPQIRFIIGAALVTVALSGSALALFGPGHIKESGKNLIMHNNTYSSQRIGLGDLFVWEGELTRKDIRKSGGLYKKELKIQSLKGTFWIFGTAAMALIALYIIRTRRPIYELVHFAAMPMFAVTNAQMNYYNLRMVLVLWHTSQMTRRPLYHGLGMVMLMTTEILGHIFQYDRHPRYVTTTVTSICLAVYYSVMAIWMVIEIVKTFLPEEKQIKV